MLESSSELCKEGALFHEKNSDIAELQWQLMSGSTPTAKTGPDNDRTGGDGHYYYLETSEKVVDKRLFKFNSFC